MTQPAQETFASPQTTTTLFLQQDHAPPKQLKPWLSIIIPARNEAACIGATVRRARMAKGSQVIVVDGQSDDKTTLIAQSAGATVLTSPPGRAWQMNHGATHATGDTLVFLHADTLLPRGFDKHIRATLSQQEVVAGAFQLRINARRRSLRFIETMANLRSHHLQMPYGDQALFLKADIFRQIGGYQELPVMEDYEMIRRLRQRGQVRTCQALVRTSARRWLTHGVCRTTFAHQLMIVGYHLGVSPRRIAGWRSI